MNVESEANEKNVAVDRVVIPEQSVKVIGNDVIREIVEQAHMAGQIDAGIDPSYSNARNYYDGLFEV